MCLFDTAEDRSPTRRASAGSGVRPVLEHGVSSSSSVERPPPVPERVISEDDYEPVCASYCRV
jgi:hypothetical protein